MNNEPAATLPRRRRWPRRLALGAVITLVVLLVSHLVWYLVATADLKQAQAEAAAAGLSQDPASVIPPPCADADNAALRYQKAYGLLTLGGKPYVPGESSGELDPRLGALLVRLESAKDPESAIATDAAATLSLLEHEDFARAWRLVAEGARLPRCRFDLRYEAGTAINLTHFSLLQHVTKLGGVRARLLAATGRTQEAADQFADLLWMLRQARNEKCNFMGLMVSMSGEQRVLKDLRRALEAGQLATADLARSRLALEAAQWTEAWRRALHGECAFGSWAYRTMNSYWFGAPLLAGDWACYLRLFTGELSNRLPAGAELGTWYPLTSMIIPALRTVRSGMVNTARLAATAGLALRAAAGEIPTALPDVAVERGDDGSWLISPTVGPNPSSSEQKMLVPWRVPARR